MKTDAGSGWEREKRTHFDEIVSNYDKARWDYPAELFSDAVRYAGSGKGRRAVEIGAGTGKATTPFLDAGYAVTAVEMGGNMAAFLTEKFKDNARFDVVNATFEDVLLEENSYELIYAASSFHWVDADVGCPKALRLLKRGGALALFRNNAKPQVDELYHESQTFYEKHYYSHYTSSGRPVNRSRESYYSPSEISRGFGFEGLELYGFTDTIMKFYETELTYSADEYIALLDTYSDHRALPEVNRAALYAGVRGAIIRHGGQQKLNCLFQLYMGRKG